MQRLFLIKSRSFLQAQQRTLMSFLQVLTHLREYPSAVSPVYRVEQRNSGSFHHQPSRTRFCAPVCSARGLLSPLASASQHRSGCAESWSFWDHNYGVSGSSLQTSMETDTHWPEEWWKGLSCLISCQFNKWQVNICLTMSSLLSFLAFSSLGDKTESNTSATVDSRLRVYLP